MRRRLLYIVYIIPAQYSTQTTRDVFMEPLVVISGITPNPPRWTEEQ